MGGQVAFDPIYAHRVSSVVENHRDGHRFFVRGIGFGTPFRIPTTVHVLFRAYCHPVHGGHYVPGFRHYRPSIACSEGASHLCPDGARLCLEGARPCPGGASCYCPGGANPGAHLVPLFKGLRFDFGPTLLAQEEQAIIAQEGQAAVPQWHCLFSTRRRYHQGRSGASSISGLQSYTVGVVKQSYFGSSTATDVMGSRRSPHPFADMTLF